MTDTGATVPSEEETRQNGKDAEIRRGLNDPSLFVNRELSWLAFNERVLEESLDPSWKLLERAKFLSIFFSNLDEFFMIRVAGLHRQQEMGALKAPPDGMTPVEQLARIRMKLGSHLRQASHCWREQLLPDLRKKGVSILEYGDLSDRQCEHLRWDFIKKVYPILTPQAIDPGRPFPLISNLSVNLMVVLTDAELGELFARIKVPRTLPRFWPVPCDEEAPSDQDDLEARFFEPTRFVWLEDIIAANVSELFPGLEVRSVHPFRVTRNTDIEIEEDEASDLLTAVEEGIEQRRFGSAIRLEVQKGMPRSQVSFITKRLGLVPFQVYEVDGHLDLSSIMELLKVDRPDLKDKPFMPVVPAPIEGREDLFAVLRMHDVLLYHPYESFQPVVDLIRRAAEDPDVLAIKMTLYRVGLDSPIVDALRDARLNGKQVTALVELKARFDEENNITWARSLEHAGVHVVYGLVGLKTHCKLCLIIRREHDGLVPYVHMSTGNYNQVTTRVYTDIGFMTTDAEIAADVADVFNALTGYSGKKAYRKLLVAPGAMREEILARIEGETELHRRNGNGYIAFKMNQLVDKKCIKALYRASQEGVRIDLQVRGICCLRPGVPGVSDTITVTSIVGRFLEHSRIYYFHNGGNSEVLLGSADLMPRNLDRRMEVLFPVEDPFLRRAIAETILFRHLQDTAKLRRMLADGSYERVRPGEGKLPRDSQHWMLKHKGVWNMREE